jgi:DNA-binding protein HU-beta
VEAMLTGIIDAAKQGDEINLTGFGKFKVRNSPARQGRNPATGETIEIAASRKLGFSRRLRSHRAGSLHPPPQRS